MTSGSARRLIGSVVFLSAMAWASQAHAQIGVGTWVRTDAQGKGLTMTVEPCCGGGLRLIYHVPVPGQPAMTLTVDSPLNGSEVPAVVGGKPSAETMAIKRIDDHHYTAVVKMGGQPLGTSTGTLSADGKTLTVESIQTNRGGKAEKTIETWVRK
jgi:hypothetical protein